MASISRMDAYGRSEPAASSQVNDLTSRAVPLNVLDLDRRFASYGDVLAIHRPREPSLQHLRERHALDLRG
jgi:hypothetical protein